MNPNRTRRHTKRSATKVGLPHFSEHDWHRWHKIASDPETLAPTYAEWRVAAEATASRLRNAGLEVVWVELDPESFLHWCTTRGLQSDAESRSRYAAERVGNIPPTPEQPSPAS